MLRIVKHIFSKVDRASLLLFVGTVLVCTVSAEAMIRWHIFGANAWSYSRMQHVRHIGKSGLLQASPYQEILWELRPGVDTEYKLFPFKTNSQGLRDEEYSFEKPSGTYRVAVIGDSFTMGEGVAIENVYHSVLEQRFNAKANGKHYEFLNFGVAGYSLIQYPPTIKHKVLKYNPDLILIGFCAANDSKLPNLEAFKHPYRVKSPGNGFFHMYFFELIGDAYKWIYKSLRDRTPGYNADPKYVEEQFQVLAALEAAHKIPIVIAYIDNKAASADFEMVRTAAQRNGFEFIDATKNFSATVSKQHIIYRTDNHPNAAANKILAENIFPDLQALIDSSADVLHTAREFLDLVLLRRL